MPDRFLEPFVTVPEGRSFRAAVVKADCARSGDEALPSSRSRAVLVHAGAVMLHPAQLIRRASDGAVFAVTGDDALNRSPGCASFSLAEVEVERTVYACDE